MSWTELSVVVALVLLQLCCIAHSASSRVIYQNQIDVGDQCRIGIHLREVENVCHLLKKYITLTAESEFCRNVTISNLQNKLMLDLLSQPAKLSQVAMEPNLFIDCTLPSIQVCKKQPYVNSWKNDRAKFLDSLLDLIKSNSKTEHDLLNFIDAYEEGGLKLTSLESVQLFASAYILRPNCSFVLNRFGQSLELVGNSNLKNSLYEIGVKNGVWPSKLQRPEMDYSRDLTSRPWHNSNQFSFVQILEEKYTVMKEELYNILSMNHTMFGTENENLNAFSGGDWTALIIKSAHGYSTFSSHLPRTTQILQSISEEFLLVKYSSLKPGTHIRPHTGPSNKRLRAHFCITHTGGARMRVGEEWRTWREGEVLILDSSFEHEVIHNGKDTRIVLILDIWHPDYLSQIH